MGQTLIDIVLEWAAAERAVCMAVAEYARIGNIIGERLNFLDDHADYRRTAVELEQDRAILTEQRSAGGKVVEAEAHASKLLAALRLAADAALPPSPGISVD
jgi:hypothetical protein